MRHIKGVTYLLSNFRISTHYLNATYCVTLNHINCHRPTHTHTHTHTHAIKGSTYSHSTHIHIHKHTHFDEQTNRHEDVLRLRHQYQQNLRMKFVCKFNFYPNGLILATMSLHRFTGSVSHKYCDTLIIDNVFCNTLLICEF